MPKLATDAAAALASAAEATAMASAALRFAASICARETKNERHVGLSKKQVLKAIYSQAGKFVHAISRIHTSTRLSSCCTMSIVDSSTAFAS